MIKIKSFTIKRYRSIMELIINVDEDNNYITICGENNAGKTNSLRAVDLFFNPEKYVAEKDSPNHKYHGSRGGAVFPEITIEFLVDGKDRIKIKREFNNDGLNKTSGEKLKVAGLRDKKHKMQEKEVVAFLKKIQFFFVESINISLPKLINGMIDEIYDLEYEKSQFRGLKKELKDSFDNYIKGLLEILNKLANEINPVFKQYKEDWGVGFDLTSDITKFRDLITDDVLFYINDQSNKRIDAKGAGLQRLAYILLHFRIIEKISNKSIILLIDEPDVYLHQGLQKKLYDDLQKLTNKAQTFVTSHSQVFIDTYTLKNVFLLDLDINLRYFDRKKQHFNVLETKLVNLDKEDGAKKIKEYLGITEEDYELLENYNLIVEGETDKKYLEELASFFKLNIPKIISANGADNIEKYLDFYNSFYQNIDQKIKVPTIVILLDNDNKGREVFKKLISIKKKGKYRFLNLEVQFIPNFLGERPMDENVEKINSDLQIEDFLYPRVFCFLVNELLKKKGLKLINVEEISKKIEKPAHKDRGILHMVENEKNDTNPDSGQVLNFVSSSSASEQVKSGLSGFFKIKGNRNISQLLLAEDKKYPQVRNFLENILNSKNYIK
ncbi:ATP-dependent nuclease [Metabacillus indicus]|uniref:ATP-dependent nuclease n=1 Tax=Metabacillus indicus TaxID=246786 RepID=UPI000691FAE5|nr:AAA family ATPase [Metabacillus indicus]